MSENVIMLAMVMVFIRYMCAVVDDIISPKFKISGEIVDRKEVIKRYNELVSEVNELRNKVNLYHNIMKV